MQGDAQPARGQRRPARRRGLTARSPGHNCSESAVENAAFRPSGAIDWRRGPSAPISDRVPAAQLRRTRAFARGLARAAALPLLAGVGGVGLALGTSRGWREALRRAAEINGVDPAPLLAGYPLSRACANPVFAFDGCGTVAAGWWIALAALVGLGALTAVATCTAIWLRRAGNDPDRVGNAMAAAITLATVATGVVLAAGLVATHVGIGVLRLRPPIETGALTALWLCGAAALVRLVRACRPGAEPQPDRLHGVRIDREDAPRLLALIDDVAGLLRVAPPDHVVASVGGGCFVSGRPFVCGGDRLFGVTLQLSIPWCRRLSDDELRAVITHELAHVEGGDLVFGVQTDAEIDRAARVCEAMTAPAMTSAMEVFGQTLVHETEPVRQAQETRADSIAARIAGPRPAASALVKIALTCGETPEAVLDRVTALGIALETASADAARAPAADAWALTAEAADLERRATQATSDAQLDDAPQTPRFGLSMRAAGVAWWITVLVIAGAAGWISPRRDPRSPAPALAQTADPRGREPMPDPVRLLDDLHAGRYEALDAALVDAVRRARTSPLDELVGDVAFRTFETSDTRIAPHLDAWIARLPASAVALVARAEYRSGQGWSARGGAYRTTQAQRAEMSRFFAWATTDARAALRLDPTLVEADVALLRMGPVTGGCDALAAAGLVKRPASYRLRSLYMHCKLPRWGGSYREMRAFAIASLSRASENPRLRALGGRLDWDAGRLASEAGDDDRALAFHDRALAYGPEEQVHRARAIIHTRREDYPTALDEIEAALRLRPEDADLVRRRAAMLAATGRLENAADAVLRAERLDPAMPGLAETRRYVTGHLLREGNALGQRGDHAAALALLQPVLVFDPGNRQACVQVPYILTRAHRAPEADAVLRACSTAQDR